MAEEWSEKSRFESKFGGGYITAAQYLAEKMCKRMANKNEDYLPPRFWESREHRQSYYVQLRLAYALLKEYESDAIFKALDSGKGRLAYSLGAPFLRPLIKVEHERILRRRKLWEEARALEEAQGCPPKKEEPVEWKPRKPFVHKKSILTKLKETDEEDARRKEAEKAENGPVKENTVEERPPAEGGAGNENEVKERPLVGIGGPRQLRRPGEKSTYEKILEVEAEMAEREKAEREAAKTESEEGKKNAVENEAIPPEKEAGGENQVEERPLVGKSGPRPFVPSGKSLFTKFRGL